MAEYLECDYEKNCTPLYKAIEHAILQDNDDEYDHIATFLETGSWPAGIDIVDAARSGSATAEMQAKTWVTRFVGASTPTSAGMSDAASTPRRKIEWSQLPIHLAVVGGAPSNIIGGLVKLYPLGLRCTDDQQMLPLHLALRHGAEDEIVAYLLMQFPDAVNAKGKKGRTPVDCALRARDKVRGIILETFVEKTKSSLISAFQRQKAVMQGSLDGARHQLEEALEKANAKESSLTELEEKHRETVKELEMSKAVHAAAEVSRKAILEELQHEKEEFVETAYLKIEKLESEKLTESIEFQKTIELLQAEKVVAEHEVEKAKEEKDKLRKELDTVQKQLANAVTPEDWNKLKEEAGLMNSYRLSRTMTETRAGIKELLSTVKENKEAGGDTNLKSDLKTLKKSLNKIEKTEHSKQSTEQVEALKDEVDKLRAELKDRTEASRTKLEVAMLKKSLESELRNTDNKTAEQMAALKKAIDAANPVILENKVGAELASLKAELESLRLELKENELSLKTKQDLEDLHESLATALAGATDATVKQELSEMKKTAEGLSATVHANTSRDTFLEVSKDVVALKNSMQKKVAAEKIKSESSQLLESVESNLEKSKGMSQQLELVALKRNIAAIANQREHLEEKDVEELVKMRSELGELRKGLKEVEDATKTQNDLKALKETVDAELEKCTEKTQKELAEMHTAIDAVNLELQQSKILKDTLTAAILKTNQKTEMELLQMKQTAAAMKTAKLETKDKSEWESIRQEMEKLKVELKHRNEAKMDEELQLVKAALEQINEEHAKKTDGKIDTLRKEVEDLRVEVASPRKRQLNVVESSENVEVKLASPKSNSKEPKKKRGLMKFFSRRSSRPSSSKRLTKSEPSVPTILPPSGTTTKASDSTRNAAEMSSSDDEGRRKPPAVKSVLSNEKEPATQKSETKEMEVTLELHKTFSQAAKEHDVDDNEDEDEHEKGLSVSVDKDSIKALPSFSPRKKKSAIRNAVAMRKVKSMSTTDARVQFDPYEVVRTWSKTVVQPTITEDVEIEQVGSEQMSQ